MRYAVMTTIILWVLLLVTITTMADGAHVTTQDDIDDWYEPGEMQDKATAAVCLPKKARYYKGKFIMGGRRSTKASSYAACKRVCAKKSVCEGITYFKRTLKGGKTREYCYILRKEDFDDSNTAWASARNSKTVQILFRKC